MKDNPLRNKWISSLINSNLTYLKKQITEINILDKVYEFDDKKILSITSGCFNVNKEKSLEITYNGIWEMPHPKPIDLAIGEAMINSRKVLNFEEAHLLGSTPSILVNDALISPDNILCKTRKYDDSVKSLINSYFRGTETDKHIKHAFLLSRHSDSFGHWAPDVLPKLRIFEKYNEKTDTDLELIIGNELNSWQKESLQLMGYDTNSILKHDRGKTFVHNLHVPSHSQIAGYQLGVYPSPEDLRWVRNRGVNNLSETDNSFSDRIYISRADVDRRQVINEDEVINTLDRFGFETYLPGKMSYTDQVELFSNANIIVGPHGSGLSNAIFASDATLVEFVIPEKTNIHFFVLANLIGLDYEYVSSEAKKETGEYFGHSDMYVNTEQLDHALKQILG